MPEFEACRGVGWFGVAMARRGYAGDISAVGPWASRAAPPTPKGAAGHLTQKGQRPTSAPRPLRLLISKIWAVQALSYLFVIFT